jgi:hypothetical protein|tara:strand:- start:309 stop:467 length:159 start_codon:yes stop_codon:yes gene_type:complete
MGTQDITLTIKFDCSIFIGTATIRARGAFPIKGAKTGRRGFAAPVMPTADAL